MNEAVQRIHQQCNEERYNRKFIDVMIREEITSSVDIMYRIGHGIKLIEEYMSKQYYQSKMDRIEQLKAINITQMVEDIFVGIAYYQYPELFTSVTAQLAGRLGFSDKTEAITTMAEIVAVLCNTDAFDIKKADKYASLMVVSRMPLSQKLKDFIEHSQYLPPMVCEPNELVNNHSSGYLTVGCDSLILGSGNHHNDDICLDVLNKMNRVELSLDLEFICKFEEEPTYKLVTPDQRDQWKRYKKQCYRFYDLIQSQGNRFYLTHKADKRGRIYPSGYHITTQGTAFKKAMINLAKEELVTGI